MGRSTTASGGQAVVDEKSQVVLAASLRQSPADCSALPGMLTELASSLAAAGIKGGPRTLLADAGYFSADNVEAVTDAGIDPLLATGRLKHGEKPPAAPRGRSPKDLTPKQRMSRKLRTKTGKADYARRKAIVEPVFGQINVAQCGHQLRPTRPGQSRHRVDLPPGLPQLPQARRIRMDHQPDGQNLKVSGIPLRHDKGQHGRITAAISTPRVPPPPGLATGLRRPPAPSCPRATPATVSDSGS